MGVYFNGAERLQRGRGIGGLLRGASKLFAPLFSFVKQAATSNTGKKLVGAVKKQAIKSSINIAKDVVAGKKIKESLTDEFEKAKHQSKRKAIDLGVEYLKTKNQPKKVKKESAVNKKKKKKKKNSKRKIDIFQ